MSKELTVTVPNDIKLELDEGVLTLKTGSKLYVPNGNGLFDVQTTASDIAATNQYNGKYMVIRQNSASLFCARIECCLSGAINDRPSGLQYTSGLYYAIDENKIYYTGNSGTNWYRSQYTSLPLAIITVSSGGISSIDQVFNGFGYIGSEYFATPNITGIVPNGVDENGNQLYLECSTNKLLMAEKKSNYPYLIGDGVHYTSIYFAHKGNIYQGISNMFFENGKMLLGTPYGGDSVVVNPEQIKKGKLIGQYANSPVIVKLVNGITTLFNDNIFIGSWYDAIFNMKTATGYGLDVWGKILNRGRDFVYNGTEYYLEGEQTIGGNHFTAEEMESLYRLVLQITAMRYIGNASLNAINNILQTIFKDYGIAYVYEYGTMKIRYVFQFYVNDVLKAIVETLNMHPAGVLTSFEYLPLGEFMGFYNDDIVDPDDQPYTPFDNKPFYK